MVDNLRLIVAETNLLFKINQLGIVINRSVDFFPYIVLISTFASQMVLLGFIFTSLLSLLEQVTIWSRIFSVQSERDQRSEKKKEKKPRKKHFSVTGI